MDNVRFIPAAACYYVMCVKLTWKTPHFVI